MNHEPKGWSCLVRRYSCAFLVFVMILGRSSSAAQQVTIDYSACAGMYQVVVAMHGRASEQEISSQLNRLLATRPYRLMFAHYNRSWRPNELPLDVFRRMILSLRFPDEYHTGENARADIMRKRWQLYYDNPQLYARELGQLRRGHLTARIKAGIGYAKAWLPPEWKIPPFYLAIIPNGGSPAFAFDGAEGYDFLQLAQETPGEIDWNWLLGTIAHESHHLGFHLPPPAGMDPQNKILFDVATLAMSEGAATYFISGPPSGRAPSLSEARFHVFTPQLTTIWRGKVRDERTMVDRQASMLLRAESGQLSDEDVEASLREQWYSGLLGDAYVLGSEMFGAIYAAFGKQGVFDAMRHPFRFIVLYNEALSAKPELLKDCIPFPSKICELLNRIQPD